MGPTGTKIATAMDSLKNKFCEKNDVASQHSEKFFKVYSLEEQIKNDIGSSLSVYLDKDDFEYQDFHFTDAFNKIVQKIKDEKPEHAIISMNVPHIRDDRFFPSFSIKTINNFSPEVIITLIDDALSCWARISTRERERHERSYFRIRDMFTWRSASILLGDIFAKTLNINNYLVSVKHPSIMLYKLIFEREETIRVYSAFPISSTRDFPKKKKVIDEFRVKIHENFCAFDPATIDDRLLVPNRKLEKREGSFIFKKDMRWNLSEGFPMVSDDDTWDENDSLAVPTEQIEEVTTTLSSSEKSIVDKHILHRDYRMIHASHVLIACRPFFNKIPSRGVTAEIQYATQTAGRPCFLLWKEKEDGKQEDSPFGGKGVILEDIDELISNVYKGKVDYKN